MTRTTAAFASLLLITVLAATSGSSQSPLVTDDAPVRVDVDADLCDHHTKRCPSVDPAAADLEPVRGIILKQPVPPASYFTSPPAASADGASSRGVGASVEEDGHVHVHANVNLRPHGVPVHENINLHVHAPTGTNDTGVPGPEDVPTLPGGSDREPFVPCGDPRGCPDLIVDSTRLLNGGIETRTFDEDDCNVQEGSTQAGTRKLLRFTFTTPNFGDGDLVIGNPLDHEEWFEWGKCHGHYHFQEFADYRFWTLEGYLDWQVARATHPNTTAAEIFEEDPSLLDGFVAGHKQGFCVIDVDWYDVFAAQNYMHCLDQGISRGWADEYHYWLDGQFIDITGLGPGQYVLEAEVNAERFYQEKDYGNNVGAVLFTLS